MNHTIPVRFDDGAIVIFFSRTGNTRAMAQQIAAEKRAKLLELKAPGFGTTVGGWLKSQWTGIFQSNVETEIPSAVFSSRNVVYLGFPIWYWHAASPLRSFVERSQFDKTCVVLFATMESSYSESSIQEFRQWLNRHGADDGGFLPLKLKSLSDRSAEGIEAETRRLLATNNRPCVTPSPP